MTQDLQPLYEPTYKPNVPVVDITFETDVNGNKRGSSGYVISDATLVFSHPNRDTLMPIRTYIKDKSGNDTQPVRYIRAASKLERKINKNTIYINFPTYTEGSGGYGYDLGFTEDTFTLSMASEDWSEYEKVCKLVKLNNGEASGYMHIGPSSSVISTSDYPFNDYKDSGGTWHHTSETYNIPWYKVIVRTSDVKMDVGKMVYTYDITLTVVYNG